MVRPALCVFFFPLVVSLLQFGWGVGGGKALRVGLGERGRSLPADPKGDVSFSRHSLAWLLKAVALDICTSCEGMCTGTKLKEKKE